MDDYRIGVISDTHGLLRPEALQALEGSELILHAGDVGKPDVLEALGAVAPVMAVRGNVDRGAWAEQLPESRTVDEQQIQIHVIHNVQELKVDPSAAGFKAVISGHSHRPLVAFKDGVLFLNPGSAGPRRFKLPVSLALLTLIDGALHPQLVELEI